MSNVKQTNQGIFDRVCEVFVDKQAGPSKTKEGTCFYSHTINGFGCAIGCDLPKYIANNLSENCSINHFLMDNLVIFSWRTEEERQAIEFVRQRYADVHKGLLSALQSWHDTGMEDQTTEERAAHLKRIARAYDLETTLG